MNDANRATHEPNKDMWGSCFNGMIVQHKMGENILIQRDCSGLCDQSKINPFKSFIVVTLVDDEQS